MPNGNSIDDFVKLSEKYKIPEAELTLRYYLEYRALKESRLYSEEMCMFSSYKRLESWCKDEKRDKG